MLVMLNELYQALDPVALSLGMFQVRWYGLAYIAGFVCAGLGLYAIARRWRIAFDSYDVLVFMCFCAFGVIIGGRLGYCLFYGNGYYLAHPLAILAVNRGGMSFHGGLLGILAGGLLYARVYHASFLTLADLGACVAPIGLFFGRCANFVNGELYGAPTTLPWGVDFTGSGVMYHPSQLYEALLEGVLLLLVLNLLARRVPARPQGTFLGAFLVGYACCRILVEFVRLPDEQIGYFFGTWGTMGQALSLPMLVLGVALLAFAACTKRPQRGLALPQDATGHEDAR